MRALWLALLVVGAAVGAAGCDTTVGVATLDSLDGVELEHEHEALGGPPAQVVYLDFDGAAIQYGDWRQDSAQTSTSFIVKNGVANVPAFDSGPWGERGH